MATQTDPQDRPEIKTTDDLLTDYKRTCEQIDAKYKRASERRPQTSGFPLSRE